MKVYAIHTSGKRLFYPTEDAIRCSSIPRSEIAAITINQKGVTFPEGTFYLLGPDGKPKAGWTRVTGRLKKTKNGQNFIGPEGENPTGITETVRTIAEAING